MLPSTGEGDSLKLLHFAVVLICLEIITLTASPERVQGAA